MLALWEILVGVFLLLMILAFSVFLYANLPLQWTLGGEIPCAHYLGEASLTRVDSEKLPLDRPTLKARELFVEAPMLVMAIRRTGCGLCRKEMSELSKTADELTGYGVRLIGVVHEILGTNEFRKFVRGELYYDPEKIFFGPKHRWMPKWWGYLRLATYRSSYAAHSEGFTDTKEGECRLLGGTYLIDKNRVLYAHLENGWGDMFDLKKLMEAAKQINQQTWSKKLSVV